MEDFYPHFLRDFHEQKDFFKTMHHIYAEKFQELKNKGYDVPNWIDAQIYCIDFFLFFLAHHGYTLQKCRKKNIEFKNIHETINNYKEEMVKILQEGFKKGNNNESLGL